MLGKNPNLPLVLKPKTRQIQPFFHQLWPDSLLDAKLSQLFALAAKGEKTTGMQFPTIWWGHLLRYWDISCKKYGYIASNVRFGGFSKLRTTCWILTKNEFYSESGWKGPDPPSRRIARALSTSPTFHPGNVHTQNDWATFGMTEKWPRTTTWLWCWYSDLEVSIAMGDAPILDGLFHGKSVLEMDDTWVT